MKIRNLPQTQLHQQWNSLSLIFGVAIALAMSLSIKPLYAASHTWSGAGADAFWLTTANWDARVAGNDLLFFDGATQTSNSNNFNTDITFNAITFNATASAFTLGGFSFNLNGNITNSSSVLQTINNSMFMNATRTILLGAGGGDIRLGGNFDHGNGNSFGFTLAGTGTLTLAGSNLLFGAMTITNGQTLKLANSSALEFSPLALTGGSVVFDSSVSSHAFSLGNLTGVANLSLQDNAGSPNAVALTVGNRNQDATYSGVLSGSGSLAKAGSFTLTLNPSSAHTFAGALAVNYGTLLLDFTNMATATDLLPNGRALTLGGTVNVRGKNSGASSQTLGNLSLNANTAAGILVNSNSGAGTTLTLGNTWTRGTGGTLNIDISSGGVLASAPTSLAANNNVLGFATVRDATNVPAAGLAQLSGGNIVRLTGQTALANNSDSATTDFITAGSLTMNPASFSVNSLTLDASTTGGTLDLGGAGDVMTNISEGLLMVGTNGFTLQNGQVGAADTEVIVHQFGTGTLTNSGTFTSGTGSLIKDGTGTLILSGSTANTYSGLTTVSGGTLVLAKTAGVNAVGGNVTASSSTGAIVQLGANNQIPDTAVVTLDGGAKLQMNGKTETIAGLQTGSGDTASLVENALAATTGALTVSNSADYTFEGILRNGTGAGSLLSLFKNGSGTLTLKNTGRVANNDFSGGLTISNGTVVISDIGNGGTFSMGGAVTNFATLVLENTSGGFVGQNYGRTIFGTGNLVARGPGNVVLTTGGSGFTGNVIVSNAMLRVNSGGNNSGLLSAFGNPTAGGGRAITVMPGSIMLFAVNNIFGNATAGYGASIMPLILNGSTLISSRYNVLGDVMLTNGATLSQRATDGPGNYEAWQFRGNIIVAGNAPSLITATTPDNANTTLRANHLGPNTTFTVADVTGDANVDLTVSTVLRNQSGDFALGASTLTKAGSGTMLLNAANTYSGGTVISAGTLRLGDDAALGSATSTLMINGGALDLNGHTVTIADFNGAGSTVIASSGAPTLTIDHSVVSTYAGSVNDSGGSLSIVKNGSGIQTLSGANNYSGTTTINAGTLNLYSSKSGTGAILVNDGTSLGINVSGASVMSPSTLTLGTSTGATIEFSTISSTITAPVNAGTLTLNGTITVNIASGSFISGQTYPLIQFTSIGGLGGFVLGSLPGLGATLATNGNTIVLNVTFAPQVWTGANDNNWDTTTSGNWSFGGVSSIYTDGALATFDDGAVRPNVNLNATVSPGGIVMQNNAKNYSFSSSSASVIAGTGGLVKSGVGSLTISNLPNSYSGTTILNGGVMNVAGLANGGSPSDIGAATSDATNLVLNGGTLRYTGAGVGVDRLFSVGLFGGILDASGSGVLNLTNPGTMDFNSQTGARTLTLTGTNAGNNGVAATINDNGGVTRITKTGSGVWNLNGANTYTGPTTVSAGILRLGNASALGTSVATVNSSATLDLNGQTVSSVLALAGGAGVGGNGVLINNSGTPAEVISDINNPGIITVGGLGTTTLDHVFGPSGISIIKTNTGTLILGGTVDNSFLTVDVRQGTLLLNKASTAGIHALGGDPNCLLVNGGTARLTGTGGDQIFNSRGILVNSGVFDLNGLDETINNLSSTAGSGVITNSSSTPVTFTIGANNTAGTYSGSIRDNASGTITIVKTGTAIQTLSGTNTYSGNTTVSAGTLQFGNSNAIPSGGGRGNVSADGILDLAGYSPTLNGLSGSGAVTNSAATNVTFTVGANNQSGVFSGAVRQGVSNIAVMKIGTGAVAMSGANTYKGITIISAGKLTLSTLHQGTNAITVSDGATFGVLVSGTNVMQPFSLILGSSTGATNEYGNLSRTDITPVNVSNLTLNGTIQISVASAVAAGVYPLIHYTNINGSGGFAIGSLAIGVSASTITTNIATSTIYLTITAVTPYVWSGGTDANWDLTTPGNWTFGGPATYVNGVLAQFDDTATGPTSVNLNATVSPNSISVNNTTKNYTFSSASGNSIAGPTGLTKSGSGLLMLAGLSNSFSGGLTINAGAVVVDGNDNLGSPAIPIALNGGTLGASASFPLAANRTVTGNGSLDVAVSQTLTFLGLVSGSTNLIKTGLGTLEFTNVQRPNWTGNFTVNGGLVTAGLQNDPGNSTPLGNNSVAGRIFTVNTNGTLRFTVNNMFGNQNNVGVLPTVVLDGGTLDSTRYNQIGQVNLLNGGTLTQTATDAGNYEGYQFLSNITVSGTSPSTITSGNGKADHLGLNTVFTVADVTGNANVDLIVSTPLRNLSGDYATQPGVLIKAGAGTLLLEAANTYTGPTTVSNGTLVISSLHAGNGSFTVKDGAALGVSNAQNLASAAIASLTLGTAGATVLEFQGVSDTVIPLANVAGSLTASGTSTIQIDDTNSLTAGNVYPLVHYGTLSGTFSLSVPPGLIATLTNDTFNSWIALQVTGFGSGVNTNPTNITAVVSGNTLQLTWPGDHLGWTLQTNAVSVADTNFWFAYPGSAAVTNVNITIDSSKTNVFFRLVYP